MLRLQGRPQRYSWGSRTSIPELLGLPAGDEPLAELWLGAHPKGPASVVEGPDSTGLDDVLAAHPEALGADSRARFGDRLPYLLKVLAAEQPLSIQAHPTREQAEEGYGREDAAGIARDAAERNYVDDWPKPEMIVALTEFDALCGFRDPRETYELFQGLGVKASLEPLIGPLEARQGSAAIAEVFLDTLSQDDAHADLVTEVVAAAVGKQDAEGALGEFARTAVELDRYFPGQPTILSALLMNRVRLQPGEALFLDAGLLHSYLRGTGIEIMANSDNVLRGGFTPKHIDVGELVRCVGFDPAPPVKVERVEDRRGLIRYVTPAPEFALWQVSPSDDAIALPGDGARCLLVISGEARVRVGDDEQTYGPGEACFLAADERATVAGHGKAFLAGPGVA